MFRLSDSATLPGLLSPYCTMGLSCRLETTRLDVDLLWQALMQACQDGSIGASSAPCGYLSGCTDTVRIRAAAMRGGAMQRLPAFALLEPLMMV